MAEYYYYVIREDKHMLTFLSSFANTRLAVAVALGAIPVLSFIHGTVTGSFRKKANVPYPHCYATVEQCKSNVSSAYY